MAAILRAFTCSRVIALGGLTAASALLACGGGDEATDDGASTSSTSSSSSSSGGKSSTSSSSSSSGSAATCDPSGTYEFGAPVWSGADGICPDFAKSLNGAQDGATYTYEKNADGTFGEKDTEGGVNPMKIVEDADGQCALTGPQSLTGINVKDLDGNTVKADLKGITLVVFEGAKAGYSARAQLTSQTAGAKGLPCDLAFETTGTKK